MSPERRLVCMLLKSQVKRPNYTNASNACQETVPLPLLVLISFLARRRIKPHANFNSQGGMKTSALM
ncbi:MAG: hypothetical protein A4E19_19385 [Nitrospira sp. SG-bin1]|nr:MAG: hypothetical protein A4E19_19385 [Nitrospira sp. SG-bin1]